MNKRTTITSTDGELTLGAAEYLRACMKYVQEQGARGFDVTLQPFPWWAVECVLEEFKRLQTIVEKFRE